MQRAQYVDPSIGLDDHFLGDVGVTGRCSHVAGQEDHLQSPARLQTPPQGAAVDHAGQVDVQKRDVDPVQLYISIAALGFFYVSNMATLSVIFARDLSGIDMVQEREAQAVQMVLDYLRTKPA